MTTTVARIVAGDHASVGGGGHAMPVASRFMEHASGTRLAGPVDRLSHAAAEKPKFSLEH